MKTALTLVVLLAAAIVQARQPKILQSLGVSKVDVQQLKLPPPGRSGFSVSVRLDGQERWLDLAPHSIRGPHFQVLVQGNDGRLTPVPAGEEVTFRGRVRGENGSLVAASLTDKGLTALVRVNGTAWSVQPMSDVIPGTPAASHVVISERDAVVGAWRCGVTEEPVAHGPGHGGGTDAFLACQLAMDADYEFFVANGSSVPNTTNDISTVINGVSAIYQSDANVTFQLGTVIIRQSATQPYTTSDPNALLDQFRNHWTANQAAVVRDTAHLFTGKSLVGSIGLAYLNVICSSTFGYGLSQSRFTLNFAYRVGVTSHEIGHNFNLGHCDSSCSPCRIMCAGIGGCSGSVTSFGCSAPALWTNAPGYACLSPANNGLTLPFFEPFATTTLDYNRWPTPSNSGGVVNTNAVMERSAPNSLNLSNTASITTAGIDLTSVGNRRVFVNFWSQHQNVEAGKTLVIAYRRPVQGDYLTLQTLTSTGANGFQFLSNQLTLPTDGHGANAMLRFTAQGNQADDAWYIDDLKVSLYCRADLNQDGRLNIFDFWVYQDALRVSDAATCDWNGDGFITVLDFSAFFNASVAGCTGY